MSSIILYQKKQITKVNWPTAHVHIKNPRRRSVWSISLVVCRFNPRMMSVVLVASRSSIRTSPESMLITNNKGENITRLSSKAATEKRENRWGSGFQIVQIWSEKIFNRIITRRKFWSNCDILEFAVGSKKSWHFWMVIQDFEHWTFVWTCFWWMWMVDDDGRYWNIISSIFGNSSFPFFSSWPKDPSIFAAHASLLRRQNIQPKMEHVNILWFSKMLSVSFWIRKSHVKNRDIWHTIDEKTSYF